MLLTISSSAAALNYSTCDFSTEAIPRNTSVAPVVSTVDGLTFYTSKSKFETENPKLIEENFSKTRIKPDSVDAGIGPIDYFCNNNLFRLYSVVQGISISSLNPDSIEMVVLVPRFFGVKDISVGPAEWSDDAIITFTVPTRAFGCDLVIPLGGGPLNMEIFGASGSLGKTSVTVPQMGSKFWGVVCDSEDIVKIEFFDPKTLGELFADVQFGIPAAASLTSITWAGVKTGF